MAEPFPARDSAVQAAVDAVDAARLERTVRDLAAFPTRHTLSGARGVDAAAGYLEKTLAGYGGRLKVARQTWTQAPGSRVPAAARLSNVLAELPATVHADRVVVVSGHYDSRITDVMDATGAAPGANDDASGVAVVLECARILSRASLPTGVVFAALTGEEQGLLGARELVRALKEGGRNVVAMATHDIVGNSRGQDGRRDDRRVRLFSAGVDADEDASSSTRRRSRGLEAESRSRTLARAIRDCARRHVRGFDVDLVLRPDRFGRGGDHTPFQEQGFAAVRFTEPNEDWRHQHQDLRTEKGIVYGDLPEFVDYAYLARVARVNVAWVAEIAAAPPAPERVDLRLDLSPETTLSWPAVDGAAGYEVLWRRTTDPDWTGRRAVARSPRPRIVLPLSKDDFLFAVRAVSERGARGLATVAGR